MTRALVTQLLEALELHAKQYPHMQKGYTVDAITAAREYLATEPSGERARRKAAHESHCYQGEYEDTCKYGDTDCPAQRNSEPKPSGERAEVAERLRCIGRLVSYSDVYTKAADMLEADGKQKETKNEQQVRSEVDAMGGRQPMEVSGDCSRDNFNGDDRALVASMVALLKLDAAGCLVPHGIGGHARKLLQASITRLEADAQQATPYGWMVTGVPTVMRGSLAQEIQEQEAKRIGGTCKAFPIYTTPNAPK